MGHTKKGTNCKLFFHKRSTWIINLTNLVLLCCAVSEPSVNSDALTAGLRLPCWVIFTSKTAPETWITSVTLPRIVCLKDRWRSTYSLTFLFHAICSHLGRNWRQPSPQKTDKEDIHASKAAAWRCRHPTEARFFFATGNVQQGEILGSKFFWPKTDPGCVTSFELLNEAKKILSREHCQSQTDIALCRPENGPLVVTRIVQQFLLPFNSSKTSMYQLSLGNRTFKRRNPFTFLRCTWSQLCGLLGK